MRLLGAKAAGVTTIQDLRGKTVGVSDMASPAKNFFAVLAAKRGIDPVQEIDWRQYPPDLLAVAVEKGEVQALAHWDPDTYRFLKSGRAGRGRHQPQRRVRQAPVLRARRSRQPAARRPGDGRALTTALLKAQSYTLQQPARGGRDLRAVFAEGHRRRHRRHADQPHPQPQPDRQLR